MKIFFDNLRLKFNSVLFKWVISYTCLILIAVFVLILSYNTSVNIIKNEIIASNNYMLKQAQKNIDDILSDADSILSIVSYNQRVREIAVSDGRLDEHNLYVLNSITQDLVGLQGNIEDFFIYFEHIDEAVTPRNVLSMDLIFKTYFSDVDISFLDWKDIITSDGRRELITLNKKNGGKLYLVVSKSAFVLNFGRSNTSCVVIIDENILNEQGNEIKEINSSDILLTDKKGNVISSNDKIDIPSNWEAADENGTLTSNEYVFSKIESEVLNIDYVSVIAGSVFWEKLNYVMTLNIIGVIILILFGGILTFYFIHRNYDPINSLVKTIKHYRKGTETDINEYDIIKNSFNEIFSEKELLTQALESRETMARRFFLSKLLLGDLEKNFPIYEAFSKYNLDFNAENYAVALFNISHDILLFSEEDIDNDEREKLIGFIMANVFDELSQEKYYGIMTKIFDHYALIINLPDSISSHNANAEIQSICEKGQEFIKNNFEISFSYTVGGLYKGESAISEAYNKAYEIMQYNIVMGTMGKIIFSEDMPEISLSNDYYYSVKQENALINFVKAGDISGSRLIIDEIFEKNGEFNSPASIKYLTLDIVTTMLKVIRDNNMESRELLNDLDPLGSLNKCESISDIKKMTYTLADEFCNISVMRQKETNELQSKVIRYINKNYANFDLSVSMVADFCELHPAYLSRVYKERAGEGILERINMVRVEKAKELLLEADKSINDISSSVGYINAKSFARIFKKYFGVTPMQYRENMKA